MFDPACNIYHKKVVFVVVVVVVIPCHEIK